MKLYEKQKNNLKNSIPFIQQQYIFAKKLSTRNIKI